MYWLGIDVGTGGSRALLIDSAGQVRHAATAPHREMTMERPLWAEQHPDDWWAASQLAIRTVLKEAKVTAAEVKGVGLSGQMHGSVLLDVSGHVIRPALIWCDQRSQSQVDAINAKVGRKKILTYTANPVLTGFTLPKLLWVRDQEPKHYERVKHLLLPKDYLRYKLTGEFATEVSDASGTALFDVVKRTWSGEMASAVGIDAGILPKVYESAEVTGKISKEAAKATGLKAGTPVVGGGGDQAASAVGNGIVSAGLVSCTIGTSGVVFAHADTPNFDPAGRVHTFCHAVPGKWHVMGVTQGAGLSLQWFRNQMAPGLSYDDLMKEAATATAGCQGLFWLPYLMGERTPHLDALARGGWVGLTAGHRRADLVRSVVEGVSYSLKDCLGILHDLGVDPTSVRLSGGGAKNIFWRQLLANIFGTRTTILASQEGSAYGAALLAAVGTGAYASVPEACAATIREVEVLEPKAHESRAYQRGYEVYKTLYPTLKPLFGQMSHL
ncbi:MAG: xylulokinase [Bryobacteraceae bacterium]|nr:xylulokinase [Bryobacteraceae bacterium]